MTGPWMAALIVGTALTIAGLAWDMGRIARRDEQQERHGPRPTRAQRRQLAEIERHLASDAAASGLFAINPEETDRP